MENLNDILNYINGFISGDSRWFVFTLLATGLFFTIYLKFPQIRYFKHAIRIVTGKYDKTSDTGDTSHFQALTTALSGTVGTGNIAGVALAIHMGGPAALFWMLVTAFFGMTTKFVEVTLSHKYREKAKDGTIAGGPMYYMKNARFKIGRKVINFKYIAVIFAIATIFSSFGTGSMPQIKSIADSINTSFGINHLLTGIILSILLALVIIGGIKRIASVTSRLVPVMAIFYFFGAVAVLVNNYQNILPSFYSIFSNLFNGSAATGGFIGAGFAYAFRQGVNRGLFSNEAGQGSAPIAHAAARASEPVSEGMVAILEPFIDTIIICFLTGMVLLSSGVWNEKIENNFDLTDVYVLNTKVDGSNNTEAKILRDFLEYKNDIYLLSDSISIREGKITNPFTLIHARSITENVRFYENNALFSGKLNIINCKIITDRNISVYGKSLLHSAPLTTEAFKKSFFGQWGQYIVSLGLLLFAFSTAISWSYYGDRAVTFLWGSGAVLYFRIIYVIGFIIASFIDTKIIWTFSGITVALMTLPNLIGILWLHKDMKNTVREYWDFFYNDKKNNN